MRRATALEAETRKLFDEPSGLDEISAGVLVDLWHSDVPVVDPHVTSVVDERDARILSLVDGVTTIGTLLETSQMSHPEFLGTLCDLCARGVVTLDRSRRPPR